MSLKIINPGLSTTVQDNGRSGYRHKGIPISGHADRLSAFLANYIVGNGLSHPVLELTLLGGVYQFEKEVVFALVGATADMTLDDAHIRAGEAFRAKHGSILKIGPFTQGARLYLAVAGSFRAEQVFESCSTYENANWGGLDGRRLRAEDLIAFNQPSNIQPRSIPEGLLPKFSDSWVLRVCPSVGTVLFSTKMSESFYRHPYQVTQRFSRMGIALEGQEVKVESVVPFNSHPVFPGMVQCPAEGQPFLLGVDAQTTGGYPVIAQVIRADRYMIGQVKPGDYVRFMPVTPEMATKTLKKRNALYASWLGACPFD